MAGGGGCRGTSSSVHCTIACLDAGSTPPNGRRGTNIAQTRLMAIAAEDTVAKPAATLASPAADDDVMRHSPLEDVLALVLGSLLVALGIAMFQRAGLLTGGTAGLAFLVHYASGWPFGVLFFAINLPFYWLAWRHMGPGFTLKTFAAVALLSAETEALPQVLSFQTLAPAFAAVMGGLLVGVGLLALFRHQASIGGVGILAVLLQERRGWRAGKVQMAIDAAIIAAAFLVVPAAQVLLSVLGALSLNLVLAINHRPGRYVAR